MTDTIVFFLQTIGMIFVGCGVAVFVVGCFLAYFLNDIDEK
jgi:hypothetical protein